MIGETAKTQETSNFRNTVGSLKRLIGRTIELVNLFFSFFFPDPREKES